MHTSMSVFPMFFSHLAAGVPMYLVYLVGMAFALTRLQRSPRPAMFVFIGCALSLLTSITIAFLQAWVISRQAMNAEAGASIARTMSLLGLMSSLGHAVAIGCLVAAAFVDRPLLARPMPPIAGARQG